MIAGGYAATLRYILEMHIMSKGEHLGSAAKVCHCLPDKFLIDIGQIPFQREHIQTKHKVQHTLAHSYTDIQ